MAGDVVANYHNPQRHPPAFNHRGDSEMTTNHGGARPGAGRPPLDDTEPTERHTVTLPASLWRLLEQLGDGNRSKGVRVLKEKAKL